MNMLSRLWTRLFGLPTKDNRPSIDTPVEQVSSPVPWITDEIWSRWVWSHRLCGPSGETEPFPVLRDPRLYVVTRDDLARAPIASSEPGAALPAWKLYDENLKELQSLLADFVGIFDPAWPMCCGRLATVINEQGLGRSLASIEAETGSLDLAFMEMEIWHDWCPRNEGEIARAWQTGYREFLEKARKGDAFGGTLLFQCRACGRVYVSSCTP